MAIAGELIGQARAWFRASSALERSAKAGLWRSVREVAREGGEVAYAVASQSRAGMEHIVIKSRRSSAQQPVWALYRCSCEAGNREACIHRAAVFQFLYRARFGGVPVRLPASAPAQRAEASHVR